MRIVDFALRPSRGLVLAAGSLSLASLAACANGGSGPSTGPSALGSSSTPLTIAQSPNGFVPDAGPTTAIVLYAEQFLDAFHAFAYAVATQGPSGPSAPVAWTLSSPAISSSPRPGTILATAPPNGIELAGASLGVATLTASTRVETASIPVYFFPSIDFGCDLRASNGVAFDPGSRPRDPLAEDAYVTTPVTPTEINPCSGTAYASATGTPTTFHFPYGATIVTNGDDPARPVAAGVRRGPTFENVRATSFENDFTSISNDVLEAAANPCSATASCTTIPGGIVLFKTMGGRVVKLSIRQRINGTALLGPYEVSTDPGGPFPY